MTILRRGSRGPQVSFLQLALTRAGYLSAGETDGVFGEKTESAVKSFQVNNALTPDGVVGEKTLAALRPYYTGYLFHKIKVGDTFFRIAREYGTTVKAITDANPNVDPMNLTVGDKITVPLHFSVVPTNIPFTYTVLTACIEGLTARYPFISSSSIGNSVMGKRQYLLTLGNGDKELMYNASHHANEWITTPVLMKFLEEYSAAVANDGTIFRQSARVLFERTRLYIVPMVNPDGVDLATGELTSGSFYDSAVKISENYPSIPFPTGWKANIAGTDINVNYPALWERAKEIKFSQGYVSPAPRDYVGEYPLSALESSNMVDFTRSHDFYLTLSYHTQGRIIYWKFADYEVENSLRIAQLFSSVSGYSVEETPTASGYAGYKDWFIQTYLRPAYTIECGIGSNPLPISQFDDIYADNKGILTLSLMLG
ncbi:MAG: M14 family metallopeptidase [Acutalibacteraceae bacterium]